MNGTHSIRQCIILPSLTVSLIQSSHEWQYHFSVCPVVLTPCQYTDLCIFAGNPLGFDVDRNDSFTALAATASSSTALTALTALATATAATGRIVLERHGVIKRRRRIRITDVWTFQTSIDSIFHQRWRRIGRRGL